MIAVTEKNRCEICSLENSLSTLLVIERLYDIPNNDGLYLCHDRKATFTGKTNLHTPSLEVTEKALPVFILSTFICSLCFLLSTIMLWL